MHEALLRGDGGNQGFGYEYQTCVLFLSFFPIPGSVAALSQGFVAGAIGAYAWIRELFWGVWFTAGFHSRWWCCTGGHGKIFPAQQKGKP